MSLSDRRRDTRQSAKPHELICRGLIQENTRYREDIAMLTADNAELVFRFTRAVLDGRKDTARDIVEMLKEYTQPCWTGEEICREIIEKYLEGK